MIDSELKLRKAIVDIGKKLLEFGDITTTTTFSSQEEKDAYVHLIHSVRDALQVAKEVRLSYEDNDETCYDLEEPKETSLSRDW